MENALMLLFVLLCICVLGLALALWRLEQRVEKLEDKL